MADIFISYSKAERDLTAALARDLEAAGYTVWWDTSLVVGDDYETVIKREIDAARAAIVVWTKTSIAKDWVKAEASRARDQKKLIPVRAENVDPETLPMPFGSLQTELVTNRMAIVAGLAKLGVLPSRTYSPAKSGVRSRSGGRPGRGTRTVAVAVAVLAVAGLALAAWQWRPWNTNPAASPQVSSASVTLAPEAAAIPANVGGAATSPATECDRLAASPYDTTAVAPGVDYDSISPAAVEACKAANAADPNQPRLMAQLGRAIDKSADRAASGKPAIFAEANGWYQKASDAGSALGTFNLARNLDKGRAGNPDFPRAAGLLLKAAKLKYRPALDFLRSDMSDWDSSTRTEIQRELDRQGLYKGPIDGSWNALAKSAIEALLQ